MKVTDVRRHPEVAHQAETRLYGNKHNKVPASAKLTHHRDRRQAERRAVRAFLNDYCRGIVQ